jgi:steroid delta-isomerase-like uncharacterized protein
MGGAFPTSVLLLLRLFLSFHVISQAREEDTMSAEQNKTLVRQFFGVLNHGRLDTLDELLVPNYIAHFAGMPAPMGREDFTQFMAAFIAAFPDQQHRVEELIAEGEKVALRLVIRGTHQGPFNGIPPTGKPVTITAINILRIENGKIVEHWSEGDNLGMLQQLGVVPMPGEAPS